MSLTYKIILYPLLLMMLQLSSFLLQAKGCQLPNSMNGLTLMMPISEKFSYSRTAGNDMIEMTFKQKSYYGSGYKVSYGFIGKYSYRKLAQNVAQIRMRETFAAKVLQYNLYLVCENDLEGYYIYAPISVETDPQIGIMIERYIIK
ncbi:hypothetical protein [uncultured Shewanella sp.]|uniref:hypothetical protein n=1 Tax=uncultured Shewanella sp. TaxID=173975 RepID=UPI002607DB44|nr:hypothetical protein [uncultured Shewanella sp.]